MTGSVPGPPPEPLEAGTVEGGPTVRVAWGDLTITQASGYVADGDAHWVATLPLVLAAFPVLTYREYWALTVAEHEVLLVAAQNGASRGR